jgi:hypothetical protein
VILGFGVGVGLWVGWFGVVYATVAVVFLAVAF